MGTLAYRVPAWKRSNDQNAAPKARAKPFIVTRACDPAGTAVEGSMGAGAAIPG